MVQLLRSFAGRFLASFDSSITAGLFAVRFPSSVLRLWFSALAFSLGLGGLAEYTEMWEWVLKSRIFESCSTPGNWCFPESYIFTLIRLIRVG